MQTKPATAAAPATGATMLQIRGIHTFYGQIEALKGVDLDVRQGEIVTLIGSNGAGKSTLLMTICGTPAARAGSIVFEGKDITRLPTFQIMRLGIAQSPEGRRIFPRMTVMENLQMGALTTDEAHFAGDLERIFTLFPILKKRQGQRGGTLSGGEQQMLAIGRALMTNGRLLRSTSRRRGWRRGSCGRSGAFCSRSRRSAWRCSSSSRTTTWPCGWPIAST
jgi:branched-chain amino acid transport system ATP-binding protein